MILTLAGYSTALRVSFFDFSPEQARGIQRVPDNIVFNKDAHYPQKIAPQMACNPHDLKLRRLFHNFICSQTS